MRFSVSRGQEAGGLLECDLSDQTPSGGRWKGKVGVRCYADPTLRARLVFRRGHILIPGTNTQPTNPQPTGTVTKCHSHFHSIAASDTAKLGLGPSAS